MLVTSQRNNDAMTSTSCAFRIFELIVFNLSFNPKTLKILSLLTHIIITIYNQFQVDVPFLRALKKTESSVGRYRQGILI